MKWCLCCVVFVIGEMVGFKRSLEDTWRIVHGYTIGSFELLENGWVNLTERLLPGELDDSTYNDIDGKVRVLKWGGDCTESVGQGAMWKNRVADGELGLVMELASFGDCGRRCCDSSCAQQAWQWCVHVEGIPS